MASAPEDLLLRAQALLAEKRPAEALPAFRQLVALQPGNPSLHHGLAIALKATGDHEAAGNAFVDALRLRPDYWEAAFNLGLMLDEDGETALAERAYRRALATNPDAVRVLGNLGNLLRRAGRLEEAEGVLRRAATLAPSDASAIGNLALATLDAGRHAEARKLAERAAGLAPNEVRWWEAAGTAARLMPDAEGAVPLLERAAGFSAAEAGVHFELALARAATGDDERALQAFASARALAPAWEKLRWAEALHLPLFVCDNQEAARALERFDAGLAALESTRLPEDKATIDASLAAALGVLPFNLHYLPGEHVERQARFAHVVTRVARAAIPLEPPRIRDTPNARIRVGFVSGNLRTHVVTRFFGAFITGLDPAHFERWAWHTGATSDATTEAIAAGVEHFHAMRSTPGEIASAIRAADLDVLVYPDIGLDPPQGVLASLRLAPVQAALYGHPVTTGFESIDDFVSGEALEPAGAASHYRERLVQLPGLGAKPHAPPSPGNAGWARALRRGNEPLLLCAQSLQKLLPDFDATLARIAATTRARLVFFDRGAGLTRRFAERLSTELARRGVQASQVHFEPVHAYADYVAGLAEADLVLDSPGFSGGGTSLDALGVGALVLAFEGDRARGRQTSAMLRMLGVEELIARDSDGYVERAQALLGDASLRERLRARIRERSGRLFDDDRPVRAFADYLCSRAVASGGTTPT
ncbi:hypothetical protein BWI17_13605 [Betaproteobacteria bacterium GR16-43]|nr:hypothetical protein BWI17_13605 [Betaproteobacteria bacterium GR16-43]